MFCPQCGSTQSDELKFCKTCGANLQALRQVMASRENDDFDLSNTWVAEMFMTQADKDRKRGMTSEMKRAREIKAGVITSAAGISLMIFLLVLMGGIVATGRVSDAAAEILLRIWIVGIIPVLIGGALIFNGLVVSKRGKSELADGSESADAKELEARSGAGYLSPADTNELAPNIPFSVTDRTTRHLPSKLRDRKG